MIILPPINTVMYCWNQDMKAKKMARDMTQYYLDQMVNIKKRLNSEHARQHRMFIEERYKKNLADLADAENRMNEFQNNFEKTWV